MHSKETDAHATTRAYPEAILSARDDATGITVSIEADGETVSAIDHAGATIWRVNVIGATGKPAEGFPVVRYVAIRDGKASLVVGKNRYIDADIKTGKLRATGED